MRVTKILSAKLDCPYCGKAAVEVREEIVGGPLVYGHHTTDHTDVVNIRGPVCQVVGKELPYHLALEVRSQARTQVLT